MIHPRKKLIEVALPLAKINEESSRRKRKAPAGYPTTFHKWWAQRPLAACRAVLFASLVDDPDSDPAYRQPDGTVDEDRAGIKRAELFNLIEELVLWENSNNARVINQARAEIARCIASRKIEMGELSKDQPLVLPRSEAMVTPWDFVIRRAAPEAVNAFLAEHAPPVLDPFCGGGSIPLEAQRLGLRACASDLNPVPVLITKALIEIPPKFAGRPPVNPGWQNKRSDEKAMKAWSCAQGLAEDVRYYGQWMRDEAARRIGHLYPKVRITKEMVKDSPPLKEYAGEELTVIAWLWARTVASPSPVYQGVQVPLVQAFWLSTKAGKQTWVEPVVERSHKAYRFVVRTGKPSADEKKTIGAGTKLGRGCKFRCLLSEEPIPDSHVKEEGMRGRLGARLLALVAEGSNGRVYLAPQPDHEEVAAGVQTPNNLKGIDAPIALDKRAIWCLLYGLTSFDKLFTPRQLVALTTFSDLVQEARERVRRDAEATGFAGADYSLAEGGTGPTAYADAVALNLAAALCRSADYNSALASWRPKDNAMRSTFAKQGLPMVWDYAEANPFEKSSGGFMECVKVIADCVNTLPAQLPAQVAQLDATLSVGTQGKVIVCTDPPYYDNIGYADLSDYFYIWLRRSIGRLMPALFSTVLTPKTPELIASPYRHAGSRDGARKFFEEGFGRAFLRIHTTVEDDYPVTVFYAFKQSETDESDDHDDGPAESPGGILVSTGWETMLMGLIHAGFAITGTWPMRTEGDNRQVGIGANALASSIVLVCRARPASAPLATRKQFITALRQELPEALRNLQHGNIAPVDLAQAAIGPGMAVFTRYAKVMETDGSAMAVRTALGLINLAFCKDSLGVTIPSIFVHYPG